MKRFAITVAIIVFTSAIAFAWLTQRGLWKQYKAINSTNEPAHFETPAYYVEKMKFRASTARDFVRRNKYNDQVCFLVDMSLGSNQKRFFVYDLKKDTIRNAALVTHGRCNEYWLEGRKYGNTVGCGCTSLGKYKIGNSYYGRFGLAYKLYGLESSNNKAFERYVVLHSHDCVPDAEVKDDICQSDGCPTVAPGFLQYLKKAINASKRPVLLWIYE